ncbi:MAG: TrkA family potassium uptake protein [Clostridia bacterium]|nr:TrkA family potassium uptake protein [Clostridia bacterium]MBQ8333129.1 TrkA family potassium uptake protein [Clostridia bacterium]MBQ8370939.1 TrkA family potassium uptake protein [Clostridia bacterium]MBQ8513742.1 TrkA family potassium uptake protein [Clostridia bacterium]
MYAVIGLGRFGFALAEELASKGEEVMVIDRDREKIDAALRFTDNAFIVGELNADNLRETGIEEADVAVICIGEKLDVSILATMTVLKLGVKRVISKAKTQEQGEILSMLGAEVVYPEHDMAIRLAGKLVAPHILEYLSLGSGVDIMEIKLTGKVDGRSVIELNLRRNYGLNIIALRHDGGITTDILPTTQLYADDTITVIGKTVDIRRFEEYLH